VIRRVVSNDLGAVDTELIVENTHFYELLFIIRRLCFLLGFRVDVNDALAAGLIVHECIVKCHVNTLSAVVLIDAPIFAGV